MATLIGIPPYAGADKVDVSLEPITTLNGAAVTLQHGQRFIFALRQSPGVAVDLPGDATFGLDVDVTRMPRATATAMTLVPVNAVNGVQLVAANANRTGLKIYNDASSRMRIKYASGTPVVAPFTAPIPPDGYWEMPVLNTTAITAIWDAAETDPTKTGANITEET